MGKKWLTTFFCFCWRS